MNVRQWTLAGALGLTLAATWWAAQEDEGVVPEPAEVERAHV